jgi:hypothetical protein
VTLFGTGVSAAQEIANVWADAYVGHLFAVSLDGLTDAAAQEAATAAQEAADAAVKGWAVAGLMTESKRLAREQELAERKRVNEAARRAEIERDGKRALVKVFGKQHAARIDVWAEYTLVHVHEELALAVPRPLLDELRSRLRGELHIGPVEGKSAFGYQLATITDAGELDHVVKTVDDALEPVRELEARKRDASDADRARRNEEAAALRKAAEAKRLYGTTIDA